MKKITVKDIAKKLNISQGSVSKALGGKKGVSEKTREIVAQAADDMGYRVNTLAQGLARKNITIGIIIPNVWTEYYGDFITGINVGLNQIKDYKISGKYKYISSLYSDTDIKKALEEFADEKVDGIILCPASITELKDYTYWYNENDIPIVLLGTDLEIKEKIACVKVDSYVAGRLAGEFINMIIEKEKAVIAFVGNKDMDDHKEKIAGFSEEIKNGKAKAYKVYETQDDLEVAYNLSKKVIKEIPDIGGIYIATGNSCGVCKAIMEAGLENKICIVATDVFPEIKEYMDMGLIKGVIYQNPVLQGELAVKKIFKNIAERSEYNDALRVSPSLILKSNFDMFTRKTSENGYIY